MISAPWQRSTDILSACRRYSILRGFASFSLGKRIFFPCGTFWFAAINRFKIWRAQSGERQNSDRSALCVFPLSAILINGVWPVILSFFLEIQVQVGLACPGGHVQPRDKQGCVPQENEKCLRSMEGEQLTRRRLPALRQIPSIVVGVASSFANSTQ